MEHDNEHVNGDEGTHRLAVKFEGANLDLTYNPNGFGMKASIVYDQSNIYTMETCKEHFSASNHPVYDASLLSEGKQQIEIQHEWIVFE